VVAFPTPLRGLPEDSAYLAAFLSSVSGPIVLAGHSYGGAVITNAATGNTNIKALVYVDAFPTRARSSPSLSVVTPAPVSRRPHPDL
jgi:pimeloyl-ACP methyl ester carboxylesterase